VAGPGVSRLHHPGARVRSLALGFGLHRPLCPPLYLGSCPDHRGSPDPLRSAFISGNQRGHLAKTGARQPPHHGGLQVSRDAMHLAQRVDPGVPSPGPARSEPTVPGGSEAGGRGLALGFGVYWGVCPARYLGGCPEHRGSPNPPRSAFIRGNQRGHLAKTGARQPPHRGGLQVSRDAMRRAQRADPGVPSPGPARSEPTLP